MGVWTNIKGEHSSKKVSMKKIINSVLDGEDVVEAYEHNKFWIRFEHGGVKAAKSIEKINEPLQDCPHCKGRGVINP